MNTGSDEMSTTRGGVVERDVLPLVSAIRLDISKIC